jgi:hypothetical protein
MPNCVHANTSVEGAKNATCTESGHTGKTVCVDCGEIVSAGSVIEALEHAVIHVEAKAATTDEEGNVEYWYCETCRKVWKDEACTQVTTWEDVVLPKLDSPQNDGNGGLFILIGALAAVAVVAVVAVVVLLKKKKHTSAK